MAVLLSASQLFSQLAGWRMLLVLFALVGLPRVLSSCELAVYTHVVLPTAGYTLRMLCCCGVQNCACSLTQGRTLVEAVWNKP